MNSLKVVRKIFNRRWWLTTLVVIAGIYVLIQLGFWQLDRLEQRRDYNRTVASRWNETPFDLNTNALPADLDALEFRRIQVEGEFDYANQILLTQQTRDSIPGAVVITPLVYADDHAVLVARGWIPGNQSAPEFWPALQEPAGAPVIGLIQETQLLPSGEPPTPPAAPQTEWFRVNIDAIQPQMPYELLPVFIYQLPEDGRPSTALPYRTEPLVLDEGSHLSYAIQWFMFALILGVGYFFFINHIETREQRIAREGAESLTQTYGTQPSSGQSIAAATNENTAAGLSLQQVPPQKGHP